jgi:hypothetical protein
MKDQADGRQRQVSKSEWQENGKPEGPIAGAVDPLNGRL